MLQGFKQFILRGNVVDLAVGVVIGAAFNNVVTALVKDMLTPFISAIAHIPDFSSYEWKINGGIFMPGDFLNILISFLITAATVYFFVVLPINRITQRMNSSHKTEDPTTKKCPYCLSEISIKATKCAFCTSELKD
jgi:large conductance mechanosensitive channel